MDHKQELTFDYYTEKVTSNVIEVDNDTFTFSTVQDAVIAQYLIDKLHNLIHEARDAEDEAGNKMYDQAKRAQQMANIAIKLHHQRDHLLKMLDDNKIPYDLSEISEIT